MDQNYKDLVGYKIKHAIVMDNPIGFDRGIDSPLKVKVIYFSVQKGEKVFSVYCVDTKESGWDKEFASKYVGKNILSGGIVLRKTANSGILSNLEDLVLE